MDEVEAGHDEDGSLKEMLSLIYRATAELTRLEARDAPVERRDQVGRFLDELLREAISRRRELEQDDSP